MEWRIYPLDVLFFRGMEPMNAGEFAVVRGQFPPSPEVMQGFVRTALLEALGISFHDYDAAVRDKGGSAAARDAVDLLGGLDGELGKLDLRGPYLVRERDGTVERWYPAPLDLRRPERDGEWVRGNLGPVVESDLGSIRFLAADPGDTADNHWISHHGLGQYLEGRNVPAEHVVPTEALCCSERRVGIARDGASRTTREGMLYAPTFVRLEDRPAHGRLGIGLRVGGIAVELQKGCDKALRRLGGEGRMAMLEVHEEVSIPTAGGGNPRYRLVLLTPARWKRRTPAGWKGSWLPPDVEERDGAWSGNLDGHPVRIVSAVVAKPLRIGGWDIVRRQPKAADACVRAGSIYFVESQADLRTVHDRTLGTRRQAGFGHVVIGSW